MTEPTLPGWRMPNMHRCHVAALEHGYRIGLQIGEHGAAALSCRDVQGDRRTMVIVGDHNLEYIATVLFAKMLAEKYVPRGVPHNDRAPGS